MAIKRDIKNIKLAKEGKDKIEWAEKSMPVLRLIRERFKKEKPLKGVNIAACLHVTTETANLMRTLKAGGANLALCASNPLSTQDYAAAALVKEYGISVFAVRGENNKTYYKHIHQALDIKPQITMDDGADLVSTLHSKRKELRRQRIQDQAFFRQSVRHRAIHYRRRSPRHQYADCRLDRGRGRVRLVRSGAGHARQGHGRKRDCHRG